MEMSCVQCGKTKNIIPARAKTFKFCSYACAGEWRKQNYSGKANPNWKGGVGVKECQYCGAEFTHPVKTTFEKMKFCSKPCADKGGFRYSGEDHPNYRKDARRKNRGGSHHKWVNAVISRDNATCQQCGAKDVELHAHHIKSYKDHPDLRFDLSNGLTLCFRCHWDVHSAGNENGVNSGKLSAGNAGDNPEPSQGGNILEGVTTRGRACRRWHGTCKECQAFISKRLSDVKGKKNLFCSKSCAAKFNRNWKSRWQ